MIAAAMLAAALAAAPPAPFAFEVHRPSRRHPQLVLAPRGGERAALVVRFAAGAMDDGELPGLTRVAQHVLVEASARTPYGALVRDLHAADATLSIETGIRDATFVLEADRRGFDRLAATLLDLLLAPSVSADRELFKRARERASHDRRESSGRSDWVALIAPKVVDEAGYEREPYGRREVLDRLPPTQVAAHVGAVLSPANATVVAAGAFDAAALRARVARYTGAERPARPPPEVRTPFSLMVPARSEIYLLAFKAAWTSPEATAAGLVAAALLEERVHRVFRGKGVGYSELVEPARNGWLDLFLLVLPAHTPSSLPLGSLLEDEVVLVRDGKFSDADVERNRTWALAELARIDGDAEALARTLAGAPDPAWWGPEVAERLRTLDRAALERRFREILADAAALRVLYTPNATRRGPIPEAFRRSSR